jgi:stage V sporulation protein D (sporulation-specific penicillin-binding protein)
LGFSDITGIDLPGERKSIMYNLNSVGPVELATISFGQSISVTPLQLITATSAIANNGKLMKPRLVKALVDNDKKVIHQFEETMVRQIISKKTSEEMRYIMEAVVSDGSGKSAYIPGYRVGGKTGTAQKVVQGRYAPGLVISSFIGIAPADDPELAVLAIVDEPNGLSNFGSVVAAPIAREILEESLRYLDVKPKYSEEEAKSLIQKEVDIPELRDLTLKEAINRLAQNKLDYIIIPELAGNDQSIVIDMFPKPGARIPEKSAIMLYINSKDQASYKVIVPDLMGKTIIEANTILNALGLKLKVIGSGVAYLQSPQAGMEVEFGSIISVEFKPE